MPDKIDDNTIISTLEEAGLRFHQGESFRAEGLVSDLLKGVNSLLGKQLPQGVSGQSNSNEADEAIFLVAYTIDGSTNTRSVEIKLELPKDPAALPALIRSKIHPDRPGDPSDGLRPQRSIQCSILNIIRLDSLFGKD